MRLLILILIATTAICQGNVPPVVLFHGLGDQCTNSGFSALTQTIGKSLQTYSVCIEIGSGMFSSFFEDFAKQADEACQKLKKDPKLQGDIQVVGLSQEALLGRHIIESCDFQGKVVRYISIGGPQMGVSKVPGCFGGYFCRLVNWVVDKLVYYSPVQRYFGPAGYFSNPKAPQRYLANSAFLPSINNEKSKNQTKYDRLSGVQMMLVMFLKDSVIYPKQSQWFQFHDDKGRLVSFFDTHLYKKDLLPLKSLYSEGKISFVEINGDHLRFSNQDLQETFIPFLRGDAEKLRRTIQATHQIEDSTQALLQVQQQ